MSASKNRRGPWTACALGLVLLSMIGLTGCQVGVGGQTLPSPYYLHDDVQYFPPGPQFKLSNEAAAMRARAEEEALQR